MLFGKPLRAEISRSGSASPDVLKADKSCDECTTDFTRYGSRPVALGGIGAAETLRERCHSSRPCFACRNA